MQPVRSRRFLEQHGPLSMLNVPETTTPLRGQSVLTEAGSTTEPTTTDSDSVVALHFDERGVILSCQAEFRLHIELKFAPDASAFLGTNSVRSKRTCGHVN